jgi:hypothetical protein
MVRLREAHGFEESMNWTIGEDRVTNCTNPPKNEQSRKALAQVSITDLREIALVGNP